MNRGHRGWPRRAAFRAEHYHRGRCWRKWWGHGAAGSPARCRIPQYPPAAGRRSQRRASGGRRRYCVGLAHLWDLASHGSVDVLAGAMRHGPGVSAGRCTFTSGVLSPFVRTCARHFLGVLALGADGRALFPVRLRRVLMQRYMLRGSAFVGGACAASRCSVSRGSLTAPSSHNRRPLWQFHLTLFSPRDTWLIAWWRPGWRINYRPRILAPDHLV